MKLRNKKTGEVVVEINKIGLVWNKYGMPAEIGQYDSIAELCEEWEDYKPVEPLIKDEKVRKVVRAWVDNLRDIMCDGAITFYIDTAYCSFLTDVRRGIETRDFDVAELDLALDLDYADLEDGTAYTIVELCGEEEE